MDVMKKISIIILLVVVYACSERENKLSEGIEM